MATHSRRSLGTHRCLAVGTTGYILTEGVSLFDALYMVAITITTIGFREVFELSTAANCGHWV